MPKIKTHKGASKRFRVTASGKLKRKNRNQNHLLSKKPAKRKRALGKASYVSDADAPGIKVLIPYNL